MTTGLHERSQGRQKIVEILREWCQSEWNRDNLERIRKWTKGVEEQSESEPLMDLINSIGLNSNLRPLGILILQVMRKMSLFDITRMAGRRLGFLLAMLIASRIVGMKIREYLFAGPLKHFEAITSMIKKFKHDLPICTVGSLPFSMIGCRSSIPEDSYPVIVEHPVKSMEDAKNLRLPTLDNNKRWLDLIEPLKLFSENYTILKSSYIEAPFTMAGLFLGTEEIAKKTIKDKNLVKRCLDFCVDLIILGAKAQIDAGSDVVVLVDPTAALLSPKAYEEFGANPTRRVVEQIKVPVILHICGDTTHIIERICDTGVQGISLDSMVDIPFIIERVPSNVIIIGNIPTVETLFLGNPDRVIQECKILLDKMMNVPNYIVSPSCDLPVDTPHENVIAMMETIRRYK